MGKGKTEKKRLKAQIKLAKVQRGFSSNSQKEQASPAVRFAEGVRGIIYIIGSIHLSWQ